MFFIFKYRFYSTEKNFWKKILIFFFDRTICLWDCFFTSLHFTSILSLHSYFCWYDYRHKNFIRIIIINGRITTTTTKYNNIIFKNVSVADYLSFSVFIIIDFLGWMLFIEWMMIANIRWIFHFYIWIGFTFFSRDSIPVRNLFVRSFVRYYGHKLQFIYLFRFGSKRNSILHSNA